MQNVHLTYFKKNGTYYTDKFYSSLISKNDYYLVIQEVKNLLDFGKLPGLSSGKWDGFILVEPNYDLGVPQLIVCT